MYLCARLRDIKTLLKDMENFGELIKIRRSMRKFTDEELT